MANNNALGITEEAFEESTGSTVAEGFKAIASGAYEATIKNVIVYTNQWGGTQVHVTVDVAGTELGFRNDVGKLLKDNKENKGWTAMFKSLCHASGVSIGDLAEDGEATFKSYGKDVKGKAFTQMNGKAVIAMVRLTKDTALEEGAPFQISNDIEGVLAMDGTLSDGTDGKAVFKEKIDKCEGVFKVKSKTKKTDSTTTASATTDSNVAAAKSLI